MASITRTGVPLDEAADVTGHRVAFYLRLEDDNGGPLTGNDRFWVKITYPTNYTGDETNAGTNSWIGSVESVPAGVWSRAQKDGLYVLLKSGVVAARTANND